MEAIIAARQFDIRFRPVVDLRSHVLLAHEAIAHGPPAHALHAARELRLAAHAAGCGAALEYALVHCVLERVATQGMCRKLFVPLAPSLLSSDPFAPQRLVALCRDASIEPQAIVYKLDAGELGPCLAGAHRALEQLRAAGFGLARPEYVELDSYFSTGLQDDLVRLEFTRALVDLGRAVGSRVIATGVHSPEQCRELADLGVDAAAGEFFGEPTPKPGDPAEAIALLELMRQPDAVLTAQQLVVEVSTVDPDLLVRDFVRIVYDQAHRDAFPVVGSDGVPVGMIWRNAFLLLYSKPLHPEILSKKPVSAIMDTAPLIIDARLRLEQVSRLVTRKSRVHLTDQFIITRGGVFAGIGQTIDLLHHITKQQITQATHSNPLTSLPGNVPINDTINRLLAEDVVFVVAYVDLDYFKPFNDAYGYARGDQLLLHVAELLRENISPRTDFVGHLGGDDFVMILRSPDWAERLRRVVSEFARGVAGFYSAEHRRTGGIETADRYGELRRFGFLTMSVAILDTGAERFVSAGEMAERLQAVKARAKAVPGNCLLYSTPQGVLELLSQTALPGADGMMVANL